jgi:hypothetical protein
VRRVIPRPAPALAVLLALACSTFGLACAAPGGAPSGDPVPAKLREIVTALASVDPPRSGANPEAMARAAERIAAELRAIGLAPRLDAFEVDGASYHNVVARIGPELPADGAARPRIVVGAHYDVYGDRPGADDNASGVAALVVVASHLAARPLAADVEIVAFALEEPPYFRSSAMGSARHARALRNDAVPVRAMLSLEMLGYYCDAPGCQTYPDPEMAERFGDVGHFVAVIGRDEDRPILEPIGRAMAAATDLPVFPVAAPVELPGVDWSDHLSFWNEGFPAVLVTDTAEYRNPHYHRASDLPDTLDYERLAKAARAVAEAVAALAGAAGGTARP